MTEKYSIINPVGQGSFSKVYRAVNRDGKTVAIKRFSMISSSESRTDALSIFKEILIVSSLSHVNIIECIDFFTGIDSIFIVFPYLHFNLRRLMMIDPDYIRVNIKVITKSILDGINYIHDRGIFHCDIKPENIMIDKSPFSLKIIDFNSCKIDSSLIFKTPGTTRWYRDPDCSESSEYDELSDVWSLGCLFYFIVLGRDIFPSVNSGDHDRYITDFFKNSKSYLHPIKNVDLKIYDMIKCMLKPRRKRISIKKLLKHNFFK